MNVTRLFPGLLLGVGIAMAGCGGTAEEPVEDSSAPVEALYDPPCLGETMWTFRYYTDATMTTFVGDRRCDCDGSRRNWGVRTSYYEFTEVKCYRPQ